MYILTLGFQQKELEGTAWYRLQIIAPIIRTKKKDEIDEWIHKSKTLSSGDLVMEVRELRANNKYKHETKRKIGNPAMPQLWRCKKCGNWLIPKEIEVCSCEQ